MKLYVISAKGKTEIESKEGASLLEALAPSFGAQIHAPCGGRGTCQKCKIDIIKNGEKFTVLACQTLAEEGMQILLSEEKEIFVEAKSQESKVKADEGLEGYGIACDIGTTTIVCRLLDLQSGQCLAVLGEGNAQSTFGADVISRIQAANEGHLEDLKKAVRGQLSRMILTLVKEAAERQKTTEMQERESLKRLEKDLLPEIKKMAIAANTTMCHLLTGLDPAGLGLAPFKPLSLFGKEVPAEELELPISGKVYICPAVSGYVGGDITADLLAISADQRTEPVLLIDVGTNGEIALGCGDHFLCCSTAAGPAFEGAQIKCGMTAAAGAISSVFWEAGQLQYKTIGETEAIGICGSGLIDAVAVMLEIGAIDETGRMLDPEDEDDQEEMSQEAEKYLFWTEEEELAFRLSEQVYVTQADIRKLQLGKGAIAAGLQVLRKSYEKEGRKIKEVLLAGGFGSYIRPQSAARIGLIPAEFQQITRAIGNVALEGAQAALVSASACERLIKLQKNMEYIELSGLEEFNDAYMESMLFPEE